MTFDTSNRPSSLGGIEEVDSELDDIDLSSSHYSWAHFDTETIKRKVQNFNYHCIYKSYKIYVKTFLANCLNPKI